MEGFSEDCDSMVLGTDFVEFLWTTVDKSLQTKGMKTIFLPMGLLLEGDFDLLFDEVSHQRWPFHTNLAQPLGTRLKLCNC